MQDTPINYVEMLQASRVNIIDLSDVENMDVRNLAIAEMLRGMLERQQELYQEAAKGKAEDAEINPLMTTQGRIPLLDRIAPMRPK